jgi:hypothetical protein
MVGAPWCEAISRTCDSRKIRQNPDDRFHAHQGTSLGFGWKSGEQKQAIGRSRGGRNTKIHAVADAKGRLLSILLTGGEAHDCPVAERLIRRSDAAERLLADRAYDSSELREWLKGVRDTGRHPEQMQSEAAVQIQQEIL